MASVWIGRRQNNTQGTLRVSSFDGQRDRAPVQEVDIHHGAEFARGDGLTQGLGQRGAEGFVQGLGNFRPGGLDKGGAIPFLGVSDLITRESLTLNLLLLPALLIGIFTGRKLIHLVPQRAFEILLYAFSAIAGVRMLFF